jgi:hypothetical protein
MTQTYGPFQTYSSPTGWELRLLLPGFYVVLAQLWRRQEYEGSA